MQSGVAINFWASSINPKKYAYRLAEILGSKSKDPKEIVEFLKTVDHTKLTKAQDLILTSDVSKNQKNFLCIDLKFKIKLICYFQEKQKRFFCGFAPGIDDKSSNPFMPKPISLQKDFGVPVIIGYCKREGIVFLQGTKSNYTSIIYKIY